MSRRTTYRSLLHPLTPRRMYVRGFLRAMLGANVDFSPGTIGAELERAFVALWPRDVAPALPQ